MRREDRERAKLDVVGRVVGAAVAAGGAGGPTVERVVRDALYEERRRLEHSSARSPNHQIDRAFYDGLRPRLRGAGEGEQKAVLREIVEHLVNEVTGNFDPRVYSVATKLVPRGLALLLNALSPSRLLARLPELPRLSSNVIVRGEVEAARRLSELGTIILCPTHLSNLDSPVIGWAIHAAGLRPHLYGAGINLFTNPILSFFMHNLGAYRVDRKKTAALYKEVLKAYCTVSLELGYDNLFFPGGTRSRSGGIEPRLKLGLLGCGLQAYVNNLRHARPKPNLYVVPCTLSYGLVLEAETLVDDFLKATGKGRYVIEDDESSRLSAWLRFLSGVASMDSRIYVTFSQALDLFGNRVEADGLSYDRRGRPIDIARYVTRDGEPVHDEARDHEYTKELGEEVLRAFRRDNVVHVTHLAAYALFQLLRRRHPERDLYRLLRTAPDMTVAWTDLLEAISRVTDRVRALSDASKIRLDPRVRGFHAEEVAEAAVQRFRSYHARPALCRRGDRGCTQDANLLFYYHNRLAGYGLMGTVGEGPPPPPFDLKRRPSGEPILPRTQAPVQGSETMQAPERPVEVAAR